MKSSILAVWIYLFFSAFAYIPKYFGWGHYSTTTEHQIALELGLATIMILLWFILIEIEECKEEMND